MSQIPQQKPPPPGPGGGPHPGPGGPPQPGLMANGLDNMWGENKDRRVSAKRY